MALKHYWPNYGCNWLTCNDGSKNIIGSIMAVIGSTAMTFKKNGLAWPGVQILIGNENSQ